MAGASIAAGEAVVDVGCGCGQTTLLAARASGDGPALGVDLSAPMLAEARRRAAGAALDSVRFERADAANHPFEQGRSDVAISRFGVMFFEDPHSAFAGIRRALRPGGRLVFMCWQAVTENEHMTVPFGAVAPFAAPPDLGGPERPGPFSLADPDRVRTLLSGAGFTGVECEPVREPLWMGVDAEDAAGYLSTGPAARTMLKDADAHTAAKALDALKQALRGREDPSGVWLGSAAWLVTARA
jgi:SAM-dependent methyltransferase